MKVTQEYAVINSLARQAFGQAAPTITDATGLRTFGTMVLSTEQNMDKFIGAFLDRIRSTRFRTLDLRLEFPELMRDISEWGAIRQKVNFNLPEAEVNAAWNIGEQGFTPTLYDIKKPSAFTSYFSGLATWRIMQTIPHEPLMNSGFASAEGFRGFTEGVIRAMDQKDIININNAAKAAIGSLAAEKAVRSSRSVIDVVALYNTEMRPATALTDVTAPTNKEWQRWFSGFLRNLIRYMEQPSALYNEGDGAGNAVIRATARDNMHVYLNAAAVTAVETNLGADTFHNELVSLPYYRESVAWQGLGTAAAPSMADAMTINQKTDSGASVNMKVLGMLFDREALVMGDFNQRIDTAVNMIDGYTNYAQKTNIQYHGDLSENAVILTLGTPTITPAESGNSTSADTRKAGK